MSERPENIQNLTPLRGIAASLVVVFHYQIFVRPIFPEAINPLIDKFYLWVDLFFVLSGFIIAHVYTRQFEAGLDRGRLKRYFQARFARIYPLHFATLSYLILVAVVSWLGGLRFDQAPQMLFQWDNLPLQLLLLQGTWAADEAWWNTPSWSISTEWWAYVCFPFIALAFVRFGNIARLICLPIIAVGYVWITTTLQPAFWAVRWERIGLDPEVTPIPTGTIDMVAGPALVRCILAFVLGMIVWDVWKSRWLEGPIGSGWVFVACAALLCAGWWTGTLYDPIAVLIFALLILNLAHNSDWLSKGFETPSMRWLGDISYSIYLVHMPILITGMVIADFTMENPPRVTDYAIGWDIPLWTGWLGFLIFVPMVMLVASFTYRWIECPARDYLRPSKLSSPAKSAT